MHEVTETQTPQFETSQNIDDQIREITEQYAFNQSWSRIILKKYKRLMKLKNKITIIMILLAMLLTSCVTVNLYQEPTTIKQYQERTTLIDTISMDAWY